MWGLTTKERTAWSNQPTMHAVKDRGEGKKGIWTRIGAAWPTKDGKGLSIQLDALPLDGRLILIEPKPDDKPG